jgi:hypothetical protein
MKYYMPIVIASILLCCGCAVKKTAAVNGGIEVEKIWDQAPHNAFTDILRFNNAFYSTFREGANHVSGPGGKARVLRSADGKNWESVGLFEVPDRDVRDPKISITPDNRLMVLMDVESYKDGKVASRKPYVAFSDAGGKSFSTPKESVVDPSIASWSDWVWRVTWYNGNGYAIVYQPDHIYLLRTKDGSYFEKVSAIPVDGYPNESTVRFDKNGKAYVLIRREKADQMGVLAVSDAPYQQWSYHKMDQRLGGPNFIFMGDDQLCIGSRIYSASGTNGKPGTALFLTDLNGKIHKTIELPSGGDTSYPGLLVYGGKLWVSYYSSHEGKTSIYLAKVPLQMLH